MPSSSIRRLDLATESSYMSRNANGVPDPTGLVWYPCEIADATQITAIGDTTTTAVNTSTGGFGTQPGEPLLDPSADAYSQTNSAIKSGTLTVDFYLRGDVKYGDPIDQQALLWCFYSRMSENIQISSAANGSMTTGGQISTIATPTIGDIIAYCLPDGRVTYGIETTTNAAQVLRPKQTFSEAYSPAMFGHDEDNGDLYNFAWSIPSVGGDPVPYGTRTAALRMTGDGWQQIAFGCAVTALSITCEAEGRGIRCSATIDCPCIVDVPFADIQTPTWPDANGPVLHALGSPFIVGTSSAAAVTYDNAYCASEWTLSLNWTTAGAACGSYWSGRAPLEATSLDASLELTIGHPSAASRQYFADAWKNQTKLTIILPFGGEIDVDGGQKFGGCIAIPGAYVTDGSVTNPDLSADAIQTKVTLGLSNDPADVIPYLFKLFVM